MIKTLKNHYYKLFLISLLFSIIFNLDTCTSAHKAATSSDNFFKDQKRGSLYVFSKFYGENLPILKTKGSVINYNRSDKSFPFLKLYNEHFVNLLLFPNISKNNNEYKYRIEKKEYIFLINKIKSKKNIQGINFYYLNLYKFMKDEQKWGIFEFKNKQTKSEVFLLPMHWRENIRIR